MAMIQDLASLLTPVTEETFLEAFVEKRRLHVKAADPDKATPLLPWVEINRLIESDILPADRLRVVRSNIDILPSMFRSRDRGGQLRAGALRSLLTQGASLVINRIDEIFPDIGRLADAIERRLSSTVSVNAYLSFGRGSAFKAHWDSHDVLVLQVHGRKQWRSFGSPVPFPVEGHGPTEPFPAEAIWEDRLEPGDVLYLPRGEIHDAALDGSESSVHLTIGITVPHGVDFARSMVEKASADAVARADLTHLAGDTALLEQEKRLREYLHRLVDSMSLSGFLIAEDEKRKPRPELNLGVVEQLTATTVVVPALRRRIRLLPELGSDLDAIIGGETIRLSALERRILDLLFTQNRLTFGDLGTILGPTLDRDALHEAMKELVKKALVDLEPG
jgi:ribosomal protein L16 Arg81 hydroxylase